MVPNRDPATRFRNFPFLRTRARAAAAVRSLAACLTTGEREGRGWGLGVGVEGGILGLVAADVTRGSLLHFSTQSCVLRQNLI